jgi:putative addiction module killer protein
MIIKQTKVFTKWIEKLNLLLQTLIADRLERLTKGNFSNVKSVGGGVHELKINYQKGYRIYFTNINGEIILLLCAGDKSSQNKDIQRAKEIKGAL